MRMHFGSVTVTVVCAVFLCLCSDSLRGFVVTGVRYAVWNMIVSFVLSVMCKVCDNILDVLLF